MRASATVGNAAPAGAALKKPIRKADVQFGLVGDIGGTNCRFALVAHGEIVLVAPASYPCVDFEDAYGAIKRYLEREGEGRPLAWAVVAVAGSVSEESVALTNSAWRISAAGIARRLGCA